MIFSRGKHFTKVTLRGPALLLMAFYCFGGISFSWSNDSPTLVLSGGIITEFTSRITDPNGFNRDDVATGAYFVIDSTADTSLGHLRSKLAFDGWGHKSTAQFAYIELGPILVGKNWSLMHTQYRDVPNWTGSGFDSVISPREHSTKQLRYTEFFDKTEYTYAIEEPEKGDGINSDLRFTFKSSYSSDESRLASVISVTESGKLAGAAAANFNLQETDLFFVGKYSNDSVVELSGVNLPNTSSAALAAGIYYPWSDQTTVFNGASYSRNLDDKRDYTYFTTAWFFSPSGRYRPNSGDMGFGEYLPGNALTKLQLYAFTSADNKIKLAGQLEFRLSF